MPALAESQVFPSKKPRQRGQPPTGFSTYVRLLRGGFRGVYLYLSVECFMCVCANRAGQPSRALRGLCGRHRHVLEERLHGQLQRLGDRGERRRLKHL